MFDDDSIHKATIRGVLRNPRSLVAVAVGVGSFILGLVTLNLGLLTFGLVLSALFVALNYALAGLGRSKSHKSQGPGDERY